MTQTSTLTQTDTDNLAALVNLDGRIASYRRKLSANRGNQKLANERQEILRSLQAQRKGLCALLPLEALAAYVRDAHDALMDHKGAGKMLIVARRGDAIREYRSALIGRAHLTDVATDPDVLDIAKGTTTVAAVNQRWASLVTDQPDYTGVSMAIGSLTPEYSAELAATDPKAQATALVQAMIQAADARDAQPGPATTQALNAHRDAMRDLRDALRDLGVIA